MSASTNQKVRELADRIYDGMFNAHMNPGRLCYGRDDVATLITQAIAVETAVLRDALSYVVDGPTDEERRLFRLDAEDPCNNALNWGEWHQYKQGQARAILSATDSPGAKAEDTASAEITVREVFAKAGHPCNRERIAFYGGAWYGLSDGNVAPTRFYKVVPGSKQLGWGYTPAPIPHNGELNIDLSNAPAKDCRLVLPEHIATYLRTKEQP